MATQKQKDYIEELYDYVNNNSNSMDRDIQRLYDKLQDDDITYSEISELIQLLKDEIKLI